MRLMERAVLRYEVPVDDEWHSLELTGRILHVACRLYTVVEFWAMTGEFSPVQRKFKVFGTGHPLTDDANHYIGTALAPDVRAVWHLFEHVEGSR